MMCIGVTRRQTETRLPVFRGEPNYSAPAPLVYVWCTRGILGGTGTESPACKYLTAVVCMSMKMYKEAQEELLSLVPAVATKLPYMPLPKGQPLVVRLI